MKAGEEDRTPDIQLGNLSVQGQNHLENDMFLSTPSSIPSDAVAGAAANELAAIIYAWGSLPAAVRNALAAVIAATTRE